MKRLQSQLLPRKSYQRPFAGNFATATAAALADREREQEERAALIQDQWTRPGDLPLTEPREPQFPLADLLCDLKGGAL